MTRCSLLLWGGLALIALAHPAAARASTDDALQRGTPPGESPQVQPAAGAKAEGGGNVLTRMLDYYSMEEGKASADADPNAPPGRRADFPPQPEAQPPYPFTEWSYGGATALGVTRPASVDSPLMVGLAPTSLGRALQKSNIQVYGWVEVGANISTNHVEGGNSPAGYDYNPNTIQLDQFVTYVERLPDTVQKDHVDWGFRLSTIYGVDYRYTIADSILSHQLLRLNHNYGVDFPMVYGEVFIPTIAHGLVVRAGRFVSIPDIEAQLAPNNYMYSHSMAYTFDNFTNTGILGSLAVTKNLFVQAGMVIGTDTAPWNTGERITNPFPNPLYPQSTYLKDPGAQPSFTGCIRYQSNSARDNIYLCANSINSGAWGYDNLQWTGFTYYHKFNDRFHVAFETYNLHESNVPNIDNPIAARALANGGTPFSGPDYRYNAPGAAHCRDVATLKCTASAQAVLAYWNYQLAPLFNVTLRTEYFDDPQGQHTGTATSYEDFAIGVQRWLSPQIELRPEIAYYRANAADAFNGNSDHGIAPDRRQSVILSGDMILHF